MSRETDFAELSIDSTYKTSKIHIAVDESGKPRKIILTSGNVNDWDVAYTLPDDFNLYGKVIKILLKIAQRSNAFFGHLK